MKAYILFLTVFTIEPTANAQWTVDFSRREAEMGSRKVEMREPTSYQDVVTSEPASADESGLFDKIFQPSAPTQEVVILNTEQGFVPSTIRVKEGGSYKVTVVNVNEKSKNISFVLDSFSEHHATFYGKLKSFMLTPKREGVYTFVSPETSAQGRLVVQPSGATQGPAHSPSTPELRAPASFLGE